MDPLGVITPAPISKKSLFDVNYLKNNEMIWYNLLVASDEVWNVRAVWTFETPDY